MKRFFTLTDPVVPTFHPRVLVETAVAQGADRDALFMGSGLHPAMLDQAETRISYEQFTTLVDNALRLTQNPGLGLDAGIQTHVSSMGLLGLAVMSSANTGDALGTLLRNHLSICPGLALSLHVVDGLACLQIRPTIRLPQLRFAIEMVAAALDAQARFILGRDPLLRSAQFAYPSSPHCLEFYASRYPGVPVVFDAEVTQVAFDPQMLMWPTVFAEPSTAKIAERMYVQEAGPGMADGVVAQVERVLEAGSGPPPELEEVARTLQTSSRTLRRSLRAMGTSFRTLRDASLQRRALQWAHATDMPFEEVSRRLGFSDVRSFRRAFKRWTGMLPAAVRAQRSELVHRP